MEESSGDGAREAGIFYYPHTSAPWGQKLFLALKHHTVQESATLPPREGRHSVIHLWAGTEWRQDLQGSFPEGAKSRVMLSLLGWHKLRPSVSKRKDLGSNEYEPKFLSLWSPPSHGPSE